MKILIALLALVMVGCSDNTQNVSVPAPEPTITPYRTKHITTEEGLNCVAIWLHNKTAPAGISCDWDSR